MWKEFGECNCFGLLWNYQPALCQNSVYKNTKWSTFATCSLVPFVQHSFPRITNSFIWNQFSLSVGHNRQLVLRTMTKPTIAILAVIIFFVFLPFSHTSQLYDEQYFSQGSLSFSGFIRMLFHLIWWSESNNCRDFCHSGNCVFHQFACRLRNESESPAGDQMFSSLLTPYGKQQLEVPATSGDSVQSTVLFFGDILVWNSWMSHGWYKLFL